MAISDTFHTAFSVLFAVRLSTINPCIPPVTTTLSFLLLLPPVFLLTSSSSTLVTSYIIASLFALRLTLSRSILDSVTLCFYLCVATFLNHTPVPVITLLIFLYLAPRAVSANPDTSFIPRNVRNASAFSLLAFEWVTPLLSIARRRPLEADDVAPLDDKFRTEAASERFESCWRNERSLSLALARAFGGRLAWGALFKLANDVCLFASPLILKRILLFLEAGSGDVHAGLMLAVLMLVVYVLEAISGQQYYDNTYTVQAKVRAALIRAVFGKTTRLSPQARNKYTTGQIQNLMSTDCRGLSDVALYAVDILSAVEQVIIALFLLIHLLGWEPVLAALCIMAVCAPLQMFIMKRETELTEEASKKTDERVKHVAEALSAIKLVKLYAWEVPFVKRVLKERRQELDSRQQISILEASNAIVIESLYSVLLLVLLGVYVLVGKSVDASVVFPALGLFEILFPALMYFPSLINSAAQAKTSLKRLGEFLDASELVSIIDTEYAIDQGLLQSENLDIAASEAAFSWDPDSNARPVLSSVTMRIPAGSLVAVVGPTGSGKSSILAALLGEIPAVSGKSGIRTGRSVSFCEQVPYICNASFRDNVLFGKPYNEPFYQRVLKVCALLPDLKTLPAGDLTEIGERGVNLSGGQRARVALARAVYSCSDICVLDDPLSAVDAFVGKELFKECIAGVLRQKTCLWATNQLELAASKEVDMIVVVKDGDIVESGTRTSLLENPASEFNHLLARMKEATSGEVGEASHYRRAGSHPQNGALLEYYDKGSTELDSKLESATESSDLKGKGSEAANYGSMEAGKLTQKETKSEGKVKVKHYYTYLTEFGSRWASIVLISCIIYVALDTAIGVWLGLWSDQEAPETGFYLKVFLGLSFATVIGHGVCEFSMVYGTMRAAHRLHKKLLISVLGAPMSFFYSTPQGRIVNRFSSDMNTLDSILGPTVKNLVHLIIDLTFTVGLIIWAIPPFFLVVVAVALLCYFLQEYYRKSLVDLRRLQSLSYSPLYAQFSETLVGIRTLRAYNDLPRAMHASSLYVDQIGKINYASSLTRRWLNMRINTLGAISIFGATVMAMMASTERLSTGLRGLVLSYTISIFSVMRWSVKMLTNCESRFNCVERIAEYSDRNFPQEARGLLQRRLQAHSERNHSIRNEMNQSQQPEAELLLPSTPECLKRPQGFLWPEKGRIDFIDVDMRYRPDLPPALTKVSFTVEAGEHVGIVGRTGAGKSSALMGLFRIQDLEQGQILIDGKDIARMTLSDLRSSLAVIPQEPVCFSGNIRSNLDMFGDYEDEDVQRALDLCGLQECMTEGVSLDYKVSENGSNLSMGQRQLLCLGRVLLKGSQVLVLDEATSSVSYETDDRIQKTLREEMAHCTVLTVAHRLQTVMQSDKIIVMDKGRVAEIGKPSELLSRASLLTDLVNETDELTAAHLRRLAFLPRGGKTQ